MSRKTIKICDTEFEVESNAYTRFLYKKTFGTGMMKDIKILNDTNMKQTKLREQLKKQKMKEEEINAEVGNAFLENADDFLDVILKIAYILILTANKNICSYEEWLKSIPEINLSDAWIKEVTELAASSFHG